MVLLGVGAGLSFPSLTMLAMAGATPRDSGLASGLLNTTTQVGGALGLAVLATLATNQTGLLLVEGQSTAAALSGGYHLAWGVGAAIVIGALALAVTVLKPETSVEPESVELSAQPIPGFAAAPSQGLHKCWE